MEGTIDMAIDKDVLDQLLAGAEAKTAFESNGLLDQLKKALAERALNAEMDVHLSGDNVSGRFMRCDLPGNSG